MKYKMFSIMVLCSMISFLGCSAAAKEEIAMAKTDPAAAKAHLEERLGNIKDKAQKALEIICKGAKVGTPLIVTVEERTGKEEAIATTKLVGTAVTDKCEQIESSSEEKPNE